MLENYNEELTIINETAGKKIVLKLHVESIINLSNMIKDQENNEIEQQMLKIKSLIKSIVNGNSKNIKVFRKEFNKLKISIFNEYKFQHRGSIVEKSIGLGIIFGVAIGASMTAINSASIGLGIALGLAIGAGIGSNKEKKLDEQNKLY